MVFILGDRRGSCDASIRPVRAAAPVIGTVAAKGSFRLDNATVNGNATLFEGASVETTTATSSMELIGGARLSLAPLSKGKFYGDKVVLEKGSSEVEKAAGLKIEARGLTIQPETGRASARIMLAGLNRVDVEAVTGSFRVLNSHGILVANLAAGRALELDPQPQQATQTKLTGCLVFRNGHYVITDETTNVTVELGGLGLDKEKGNRVELTGGMDPTQTPVSDASQPWRVASVKRSGERLCGNSGGWSRRRRRSETGGRRRWDRNVGNHDRDCRWRGGGGIGRRAGCGGEIFQL